jgi:hypothetical protein
MALQKNIKLKDNFEIEVEFNDAYIKVENVECTKSKIKYSIFIMKSKDGFLLSHKFDEIENNLEGFNPIKQAYLHLKTLPEFADAVDC